MQRASINELPVEILTLFLFVFIRQSEVQHVSRDLLRRVCLLWRSVIDGTPELWSTVTVVIYTYHALDIEPYRGQLAKAKGYPLSLHVDDSSYSSDSIQNVPLASTTRDILLLYSLVQHHSWRSLSIRNRQNNSFSPFEPLLRHIPQTRSTITSLYLDTLITSISPSTLELINVALAQTPYLTDLAVPQGLIKHSHPIFRTLLHFRSIVGYNATTLLEQIQDVVLLQSLYADHVDPNPWRLLNDTRSFQALRRLVVRNCTQIPEKAMLRMMQLPSIEALTLERIEGDHGYNGDQHFRSLTTGVPWMSRIRSLSLINVAIPEETLLWSLQKLCHLKRLHLASNEWVGPQIPLDLSQRTMPRHGFVCPCLEEIEFFECRQIRFEGLEVLVKARVRDIPNATPAKITGANQASPTRLREVIWDGRDMIERVAESIEKQVKLASILLKAHQGRPLVRKSPLDRIGQWFELDL
ncbi:hypothetical protein FRB94_009545 [Tulasnella sp. JGI-2019a]|nr:hypothetical protein FRB94_009545 [Tulasnella sp. JGI-2019a]